MAAVQQRGRFELARHLYVSCGISACAAVFCLKAGLPTAASRGLGAVAVGVCMVAVKRVVLVPKRESRSLSVSTAADISLVSLGFKRQSSVLEDFFLKNCLFIFIIFMVPLPSREHCCTFQGSDRQ